MSHAFPGTRMIYRQVYPTNSVPSPSHQQAIDGSGPTVHCIAQHSITPLPVAGPCAWMLECAAKQWYAAHSKPHRMHSVVAVYCYIRSGVDRVVHLCIGHDREYCKNGQTDRQKCPLGNSEADSRGPSGPCTDGNWRHLLKLHIRKVQLRQAASPPPIYGAQRSIHPSYLPGGANLPVISPNVNRFSKRFHSQNSYKLATNLLKFPQHLTCVTTQPCEIVGI